MQQRVEKLDNITREQKESFSKELYKEIKADGRPPEKYTREELIPLYKNMGIQANEGEKNKYFALTVNVALQCNEDQFVHFICDNEIPPVKLSAEQMEMLKGGFAISITCAIIGLIGAIGAAAIGGACTLGAAGIQ